MHRHLTTLSFFLLAVVLYFIGMAVPAVIFLLLGMLPMFGLALLFAGLLLRIREAGALVNLFQWVISILIGVFYPITILPLGIRWISYLLPPTWMNQGVRAAMLDLDFFFGNVYLDLMVLFAFALVFPVMGLFFYKYHESRLRRDEGVGSF